MAILPIGFEIEIPHLASIKSVEGTLSPEEEARQLAEALQHVRDEARWLLQSRLATGQRVQFVSDEQVAAIVKEVGLPPGGLPTAEQLAQFRTRAGADLVLVVNIQDYGKVRWAWAAAGMFADMTAESIIIGLASAWNPTIIFANIGFELLTSTPVWFGGAYVFGVAFRPVRVEARAIETTQGIPVWQETEVAMYAWDELDLLPESEREKKEAQLRINLESAMAGLADSLTDEGMTTTQLREHYGQ
ncbi:MAG: hypothetical protein KGN30_12125 [Nitrospirota bacterium]|nr:hypothetical protein [Nitrospirota bacterium]